MSQTNNRSNPGARRLTPEQRRRILEMRRRRRRRKQLMIAVPAALVVVIAVVLALTLPVGSKSDRSTVANATTADLQLPDGADPSESDEMIEGEGEVGSEPGEMTEGEGEVGSEPGEMTEGEGEEGLSAEPAAAAQPAENPSTYTPAGGTFVFDDAYVAAALGENTGPLIKADLSMIDAAKADRWPAVTEGYIPLLSKANTTENIVAITVDDCFQGENLRRIVQCALDNNARLTIFPIGSNLEKQNVASVVKWAWENGMEIENHTYNHVGMYHYNDERMRMEMWQQSVKLSNVLGVNYQEHFFRPKGGDERNDQRVHAYAAAMGMQGIAMWTQSGSSTPVSGLKLSPGAIYLYHTTDKDLSRLLEFIPLCARMGYRMVTLNEMFGLPDNETSDLSTIPTEAPVLESFKVNAIQLKQTTYTRAAAVVQQRLHELGWMEREPTGVYGSTTAVVTGLFQMAAGLEVDGVAGITTQEVLFSDSAPVGGKDAIEEQISKLSAANQEKVRKTLEES